MKTLEVRTTAGSWDVSADRNKKERVEQQEGEERGPGVIFRRKGSRRRVSVGVFMSVWAGQEG